VYLQKSLVVAIRSTTSGSIATCTLNSPHVSKGYQSSSLLLGGAYLYHHLERHEPEAAAGLMQNNAIIRRVHTVAMPSPRMLRRSNLLLGYY
jgi:hypothetical protein